MITRFIYISRKTKGYVGVFLRDMILMSVLNFKNSPSEICIIYGDELFIELGIFCCQLYIYIYFYGLFKAH